MRMAEDGAVRNEGTREEAICTSDEEMETFDCIDTGSRAELLNQNLIRNIWARVTEVFQYQRKAGIGKMKSTLPQH